MACFSTLYFLRKRFKISWKARGLESLPMATTSPSRMALSALTSWARRTISGRDLVTSSSRREKMRTLFPSLWICTLAPSYFHSIAADPSSCMVAEIPSPTWASIILMGWLISTFRSASVPLRALTATRPISLVRL